MKTLSLLETKVGGDVLARGVRGARLACAATLAALLSACAPITLSGHVETETTTAAVPADWDPLIGPDVDSKLVYKFETLLGKASDRIQCVGAGDVWKATTVGQRSSVVGKASEILSPESLRKISGLDVRFLIVLGSEFHLGHQSAKGTDLGLMYSSKPRQSSREAVLVGISNDSYEALIFSTTANGSDSHLWIPGGPFLLTPFFTVAETEEGALKSIAKEIAGRIVSQSNGRPVRVAILVAE